MNIRTISLLCQLLGVVAAKSSFSGNFNHFGDQIMLRALSVYTSLKCMEQPMFPWFFLSVFTWLNLKPWWSLILHVTHNSSFIIFQAEMFSSFYVKYKMSFAFLPFCLLLDSPGLSEVWTSNLLVPHTAFLVNAYFFFSLANLSDVVLILIIYGVFSGNQS